MKNALTRLFTIMPYLGAKLVSLSISQLTKPPAKFGNDMQIKYQSRSYGTASFKISQDKISQF